MEFFFSEFDVHTRAGVLLWNLFHQQILGMPFLGQSANFHRHQSSQNVVGLGLRRRGSLSVRVSENLRGDCNPS